MILEKKFKIFYSIIILLCVTSIFSAFFIEYFLGYKPCILCKYQRAPYILGLIIGLFGILKPSNTKMMIYIFLTFLISMTLSGYHVGIEQELYQSIFNCSDNNLNVLEKAKLLEKEIEQRSGGKAELSNEDALAVLTKAAKQRKESIDQYTAGNRLDLVEAEKAELEIIESYLQIHFSLLETLRTKI